MVFHETPIGLEGGLQNLVVGDDVVGIEADQEVKRIAAALTL